MRKRGEPRLGARLTIDAMAAATASLTLSPLIYIIDRAVIENAAGKQVITNSIRQSISRVLSNPRSVFFTQPFALVFVCKHYVTVILIIYSILWHIFARFHTRKANNSTANAVDTTVNHIYREDLDSSQVTSGPAKFVATTA